MAGLVIVFCSYVRNSFVIPQVSTRSNNGYEQTVPETYKMQKGLQPWDAPTTLSWGEWHYSQLLHATESWKCLSNMALQAHNLTWNSLKKSQLVEPKVWLIAVDSTMTPPCSMKIPLRTKKYIYFHWQNYSIF